MDLTILSHLKGQILLKVELLTNQNHSRTVNIGDSCLGGKKIQHLDTAEHHVNQQQLRDVGVGKTMVSGMDSLLHNLYATFDLWNVLIGTSEVDSWTARNRLDLCADRLKLAVQTDYRNPKTTA